MADDLLNRNAIRLLREDWKTPGALAKELYTIVADEPAAGVSTQSEVASRRAEAASAQGVLDLPELRQPTQTIQEYRQAKAAAPSSIASIVQQVLARPRMQVGPSQPVGVLSMPVFEPPPPSLGQPVSLPGFEPIQPIGASSLGRADAAPQAFQGPPAVNQASVPAAGFEAAVPESQTPRRPPTANVSQPEVPLAMPAQSSDEGEAHGFPRVEFTEAIAGDAYAPFGLPHAFSGSERLAAHLPSIDGPIHREADGEGDPFARKYYDLRMPLTDFDSPSTTAGTTTSFIGQSLDQSSVSGNMQGSDWANSMPTAPAAGMIQWFNIYPDGIGSPQSDDSPAPVVVPQLAENLPQNTWVSGIQQCTDGFYYVQVPVWLASSSTANDGGKTGSSSSSSSSTSNTSADA